MATGTVELLSQATMPIAARPIRAAFCPSLGDVTQPELIVQGAEDTGGPARWPPTPAEAAAAGGA